jgi:hypothetical protein
MLDGKIYLIKKMIIIVLKDIILYNLMRLIKSVCFLLNIFIVKSFVRKYNIYTPSIFNFEYYNDNNYPISIYLNSLRYRESSLQPFNKGIFSIEVNPGVYDISSDTNLLNISIEKGKFLKAKNNLRNKLINTNKVIELGHIDYFEHNDHLLKVTTMLSLIKYYKDKGVIDIFILLDNKKIFEYKLNTKESIFKSYVITYKSNDIKVKKGNHSIKIITNSIKNIWCSCPEIEDGFQYGRHLTAWIVNEKSEKDNITLKLKSKSYNTNYNVITIKYDYSLSNFINNKIIGNFVK